MLFKFENEIALCCLCVDKKSPFISMKERRTTNTLLGLRNSRTLKIYIAAWS